MRVTCSIKAFCDMLAGEDYQEINAKYRLDVSIPVLRVRSRINVDAGAEGYTVAVHDGDWSR